MPERVDVAFSPLALGGSASYVVIDVLRATTTAAVLFSRGLKTLTVTPTVGGARAMAASRGDLLLIGEEGGLRPDGFAYGNSPVEAAAAPVAGREAVMATTNGSAAICRAAELGDTFAGSLANLDALCSLLVSAETVLLVCAGNEGGRRFALEDLVAAGAIVDRLAALSPAAILGDSARLARLAWSAGGPALARQSSHSLYLRSLGFARDLEFALRPNTAPTVPRVVARGHDWARLEA